MESKHILGIMDYVAIVLSLLVSVLIGIKFRYFGAKQRTMQEYTMAGKNMSIFPVVISTCVTLLSAVTMIGLPMETYRYGTQMLMTSFGTPIGMFISSRILMPVYFKCGVSSIYEFLELRYGKTTKYLVSGLFILQMVFFMASVLCGPVLAINAVTNLSMEMSIIVFGVVCSFYCTIGGLKAVIWTDVFQAFSMAICLVALYVKGVSEAGGVAEIYRISREGQRWEFFNFQFDLTTRYTFWNSIFRAIVGSMALYGTNQVQMQRILSLSTLPRAQSALMWGIVPFTGLIAMCSFLGLVLYAVFNACDPILDRQHTGINRYDQVVPYYIVTRLGWIPGLTGVCVAGIFSGSLSSVSSALNSLATVTVLDFVKPLSLPDIFTEKRAIYVAKTLSVLYGIICIALTFAISKADSLVALTQTLLSIMEGPVLAIFLVGVLTRKCSEKCILFAILLGVSFTSCIGYGSIYSGYKYPSLPLNTTGCNENINSSSLFQNSTPSFNIPGNFKIPTNIQISSEPFFLFTISFMWLPAIGFIATLGFIFVLLLLTGWNHNSIPADSKCLCPAALWWIEKSSRSQRAVPTVDVYLEEMSRLTVPVKHQDD